MTKRGFHKILAWVLIGSMAIPTTTYAQTQDDSQITLTKTAQEQAAETDEETATNSVSTEEHVVSGTVDSSAAVDNAADLTDGENTQAENTTENGDAASGETTKESVLDVTEVPEQPVVRMASAWVHDKNGWWYRNEDGSWPASQWKEINGATYYFQSNGYIITGKWYKIDNIWYYFKSSGALAVNGWIGNYYVTGDGSMAVNTWIGSYYVGSDGKWIPGKHKTGWVKDSKGWWYNQENGSYPRNCWKLIDNVWYHFNSYGYMQTGWLKLGGRWYYLKSSGAMAIGWVKTGGSWYYMNTSGAVVTGWQSIDGHWYYLKSSGAMATGWLKLGNTWYYLYSSGAMAEGWAKISGRWYYMSASGAMKTGWQKVADTWYYMNSDGAMQTGWLKLKNTWYYMNSSGAMLVGWQSIGGSWYYLKSSGAMATGWLNTDGATYYLLGSGKMVTGTVTIEGATYNFGSDGKLVGAPTISDAQKLVMVKIIYAVETGGQVYGRQDYADFSPALNSTSNEKAITIGAGQWYATEAKTLLLKIREADPTLFAQKDTAGIGTDLDTASWSTYGYSNGVATITKGSAKALAIQAILDTEVGHQMQDQLMMEQISKYILEAEQLGVYDVKAIFMFINLRHLGGLGAAKRIIAKTAQPYTLDNIMTAMATDKQDTSSNTQVGDAIYDSRHKMVYNALNKYIG